MKDTWDGCTPDGKPPVIGQEYRIIHSRKGKFFGVVESISEPFATVVISSGVANAVLNYNIKLEGERVGVRNSLCRMDPVSETAAAETSS